MLSTTLPGGSATVTVLLASEVIWTRISIDTAKHQVFLLGIGLKAVCVHGQLAFVFFRRLLAPTNPALHRALRGLNVQPVPLNTVGPGVIAPNRTRAAVGGHLHEPIHAVGAIR